MIASPDQSELHPLSGRVHAAAIATMAAMLLGWLLSFYPYDDLLSRSGTPLGADYAMFYTAGRLYLEDGPERLYDQAEHQRRVVALFPGVSPEFCLPYRYPPLVAAAMAPLAALPYSVSYGVFLTISCGAWWTAMRLLAERTTILRGAWRRPALWLAAGWPVALETLLGGQAAMLALLIPVATIALLDRGRWVRAGCILGLAAYKPNVLLLFSLGLIVWRPRLAVGAALTGIALSLASLACAGPQVCLEYLELALRLTSGPWDLETPFWKVHSLATWLGLLAPGAGRMLALGGGAIAAVAVGLGMRRHETDAAWRSGGWSLLIAINALGNPYTPIYDLVLLTAGAVWLAETLSMRRGILREPVAGAALASLFLGPHVSQAIATACGVQLFPLALLAFALAQAWMLLRWTGATRDTTVYPSLSSASRSVSST
jgi:hypothetical protein